MKDGSGAQMGNGHLIINADDLGLSEGANKAVLSACEEGFLKSASICVNGEKFEDALKNVLPRCPGLDVGVHLNIVEGRALGGTTSLTDGKGNFNKGFFQVLLKSGDKNFLRDAEGEFRNQIEGCQKYIKIHHIDSHVHIHAIPAIFRMTVKLAREYHIPCIRTQYERAYFVPRPKKIVTLKYPVNLLKIGILNFFTRINRAAMKDSGLKTNDFIIGVGYTGMMDRDTILYGLRGLGDGSLVEAVIHPNTDTHAGEWRTLLDGELPKSITRLGFHMINYGDHAGE
jgi:predicted glycoside hydrolase/deacetylase ChbG (UPF0249 family)